MSSTERNKVKSFGDPSIDHEEMEDRFLVVGALKAPPVSNKAKDSPEGVTEVSPEGASKGSPEGVS